MGKCCKHHSKAGEFARIYGPRFLIAAFIWQALEWLIVPLVSWHFKRIEILLAMPFVHLEPIVWPLFILGFRWWDKRKAR